MASFGPYYINADNFVDASGIWTDVNLTTCAPTGYYSNGVIQRYLTNSVGSCSLGAPIQCPSCAPPLIECGGDDVGFSGTGSSRIYEATVGLGTGTGVAIVAMDPAAIPDALAVLDPSGLELTEGSTTNYGYASANVINPASSGLLANYAIWVGTQDRYDGTNGNIFPGVVIGQPAPNSICNVAGGRGADLTPGVWDPLTGGQIFTNNFAYFGFDGNTWNATGAFTGANTVKCATINMPQGGGNTSVTGCGQLGLLPSVGGLPPAAGTSVVGCQGATPGAVVGHLFVPVSKPSAGIADITFNVVSNPVSNITGYNLFLLCPKPLFEFAMSDSIASEPLPQTTPSCPSPSPDYPNSLYHCHYNTRVDYYDIMGQDMLSVNAFAFDNADGTGLRINEGGANYEWYKVDLSYGVFEASITTTTAGYCRVIPNTGTPGGGTVVETGSPANTGALIQISPQGVITRVIPCQ
tara:strand:- start:27086 stop:28483 length:1398 start_codon:yes stop_codon:yes gene_type:complete